MRINDTVQTKWIQQRIAGACKKIREGDDTDDVLIWLQYQTLTEHQQAAFSAVYEFSQRQVSKIANTVNLSEEDTLRILYHLCDLNLITQDVEASESIYLPIDHISQWLYETS